MVTVWPKSTLRSSSPWISRTGECHAATDAAAVINGEHDVALARQILVHGVGVVVIVHVVPAEQHLAARSAVHKNQRAALLAGLKIGGQEKLRVHGLVVGGVVNHL